MLSAQNFAHRRFFHFGVMESEIAELRTMTRVTKLRQQIETRTEGAWMSVKESGSGKVTSFGRASRSVTKSRKVDLESPLLPERPPLKPTEAIVEFPQEERVAAPKPTNDVEIVEIVDSNPSPPLPPKKTSVVTLGQGNLVLIDSQNDSSFKVTAIGKNPEDLTPPTTDKKTKKVGFCKTEVHFAPDSGKVNIVETDEKPPSSKVLRRKKKVRNVVVEPSMPKLHFGDLPSEQVSTAKVEHVFSVIREPSPLLSTSIANRARGAVLTADLVEEAVAEPENPIQTRIRSPPPPYLGHVSPKLSKLISNNIQHEFQLKQTKILLKENQAPVLPPAVPLRSQSAAPQPLYINSGVTSVPDGCGKAVSPKPQPTRLTSSETRKRTKVSRPLERPTARRVTPPSPKPRDLIRSTLVAPRRTHEQSPTKTRNDAPVVTKSSTPRISDKFESVHAKKGKEPLRSYEKVSSGWVGCAVPKTGQHPTAPTTRAFGVTKVSLTATSSPTSVTKSVLVNSKSSDNQVNPRGASLSSATKQFSLSKEHLKSARLVRDLCKEPSRTKPFSAPEKTAVPKSSRAACHPRRRLGYDPRTGRRDSEQSDDSVMRADEEVRAYMFDSARKVFSLVKAHLFYKLRCNYKPLTWYTW